MSVHSIVAGLTLLAAAAALPSAAAAQTIAYAEGGTTNCRAGPGTGYPVLTKVYGGTPVQILGSQGGWYSVSANGGQCWMAGSRLQFAQARAPVVVAQPYYAPSYAYQPYPYFYGGPSISFGFSSFGDFDRDRHRRRGRDRDWDWNGKGGDWDGRRDND